MVPSTEPPRSAKFALVCRAMAMPLLPGDAGESAEEWSGELWRLRASVEQTQSVQSARAKIKQGAFMVGECGRTGGNQR
eukprot:944980-Rhodomonas_salina.4